VKSKMASRCNRCHAKNVTEQRKEETWPEMLDHFAKLQIEPAFEQYQNQRESSEAVRGAAKDIGIHPMQHRTDEYPGGHQNDDIRHARKADEAVRNESKNQKTAKNRKEEIDIQLGFSDRIKMIK
jgi:hypothetical protein